jgi:DnaJ-class molecular chaperone
MTQPCERCQGNGEIVTDWNRYLTGEDAVAECPDCSGYGFNPPPEEGTTSLSATHGGAK